ncbi:hypothetical protein N431DRAFT_503866 [Stipitochalara longipes BDJ]|nr:hypothetical protein N431DRAFT_503866 [Stipitochalara longipes BDJ]
MASCCDKFGRRVIKSRGEPAVQRHGCKPSTESEPAHSAMGHLIPNFADNAELGRLLSIGPFSTNIFYAAISSFGVRSTHVSSNRDAGYPDGGFHVHMTIPLSLIGHFDPRILECRPRNRWLARLFGEGRSIQDKTFRLAIRPVFQIARQLNGLLFGREEPALGSVGSCDADNWEHFGGSNFHLTFFAGAEDDDNARVLVFEASEKLVQGSIHFSGEELGEEEKAAWIAEWMRMPGWGEPDPFYTPLQYSTTIGCLAVSTRRSRPKAYLARTATWN